MTAEKRAAIIAYDETEVDAVPNRPLMVVARPVIAAMADTETKVASNAYSIKSWPDSSLQRRFNRCFIWFSHRRAVGATTSPAMW
jgi:hypothetical protein